MKNGGGSVFAKNALPDLDSEKAGRKFNSSKSAPTGMRVRLRRLSFTLRADDRGRRLEAAMARRSGFKPRRALKTPSAIHGCQEAATPCP